MQKITISMEETILRSHRAECDLGHSRQRVAGGGVMEAGRVGALLAALAAGLQGIREKLLAASPARRKPPELRPSGS
jgi:hypothetical protein